MTLPLRRLVADIGGTHARFALADESGAIEPLVRYRTSEFGGPAEAIEAALAAASSAQVMAVGLAIAAPLATERIEMLNAAWSFSLEELATRLRRPLLVVNDFVAQAFALARLEPAALRSLGPTLPQRHAPKVVLGPGTGLGVGLLVPTPDGWEALPSEGGHATAAARTDEEAELIRLARLRFDHVSYERLVSGPGLELLHALLAEHRGSEAPPRTAAEITADPTNPLASAAMRIFVELLATAASDAVLLANAFGGVHLVGGVLEHLGPALDPALFRARFESKGRYSALLAGVPSFHVRDPLAAFRGVDYALARALAGSVPGAARTVGFGSGPNA